MPRYLKLQITTDPQSLVNTAVSYVQGKIPGWRPAEGSFAYILIQAIAQIAAVVARLASDVPDTIFRYFGATLVGIPPQDATPGHGTTTWTMIDNQGYTIPAGTQVGVRASGDTLVAFETLNTVTVSPGSTATAAGEVEIGAIIPGVAGSDLGAPGSTVELINPIYDFVSTIVLVATTSGGLDAELDADYLDRLTTELRTLAQVPILPQDFADIMLNVPGVYRAQAIDGWDPDLGTGSHARTVTMVGIDSSGAAISTPTKNAAIALLESLRETNFIVKAMDPTFSVIDVTTTVKALPGYDHTDVDTRVTAAIASFLSPATWGIPLGGANRDWVNQPILRYLELAAAINAVEGVDYITTTSGNYDLTDRVAAGTYARLDITMTGQAPLPQPGTIAVTVV